LGSSIVVVLLPSKRTVECGLGGPLAYHIFLEQVIEHGAVRGPDYLLGASVGLEEPADLIGLQAPAA
jgi:hypothetical protein